MQERFKIAPGKYEQFLHVGLGSWRDGKEPFEVKAQLMNILDGNEHVLGSASNEGSVGVCG